MAQYHTPDGPGLEPLIRELKDIRTQLRDLQRPSGTNIGNTAAQVQLLVAKVELLVIKVNETLLTIDADVQASISANSYTKTVIDQRIADKVASPPSGSAVTGNISATGGITAGSNVGATGNVSAGGSVSAGGAVSGATGTFNSGINALSVHSTLLTSDYRSVYVDSTGKFGYRL
ncbi:hypothetical protein [Cryobacterium sp. Y62]|uniref:hypothetical protein n=1 Tax=Cryobacterium sp. Y62 TaxID=2048284 RepID=UPI000CE5170D|nr:hypothetical protein [Cryobacterium sp. Y62]